MTRKDVIQISGAPASWQLPSTAQKLLGGLRKLRLIPEDAIAVLAVSCVGARDMAALNADYRGEQGPTDVLSFEQKIQPPGRGLIFLGDAVLCIPVVTAQAREQKHSTRTEAAVLLAHGLLHLLGYDHERSAATARQMTKLELKLLKTAGFAVAALSSPTREPRPAKRRVNTGRRRTSKVRR